MTRILIVDDHVLIRRGLRDLLRESPGLEVGGEASTGEEALAQLQQSHFDMVVLDLSLPDESGLETLHRMQRLRPHTPVLVLSMHAEEDYGLRALQAGAAGYVCKRCMASELTSAIQSVSAGRRYIGERLANHLAAQIGPQLNRRPHDLLSNRELEIMLQLASGKTVAQIAADTGLRPKTVSTYRSRLMEKLGMSNNVELTHYAIVHGLLGARLSPRQGRT